MGIKLFGNSWCECNSRNNIIENCDTGISRVTGQPDPRNFTVEKMKEVSGRTVVQLIYPGCTNYEGRKVLVYDMPWRQVFNTRFLDPHFCESNNHPVPIARFEPTLRGWAMAIMFAEFMTVG